MKKLKGFTLVELMITLAIAAILVTLAIPSFVDTVRKNRLSSQASSIFTALNIARSEAIKLGANVTACSSTDQATCSGANDWSTGWLIHQAGTLIKVWGGLRGGAVLTGNAASIIYTPRGMTDTTSGVAGALTLTLTATGCGANEQRIISVIQTGRANLATADCP